MNYNKKVTPKMTPSKRLPEINMIKIRLSIQVRIHITLKNYEKVVEKLPKNQLNFLLIFQISQYKNCGSTSMKNAAPLFLVPDELKSKSLCTKTRLQGFINAYFVTSNSVLLRVLADIPAKPIME